MNTTNASSPSILNRSIIEKITYLQILSGAWSLVWQVRLINECLVTFEFCYSLWYVCSGLGILTGLSLVTTGILGYRSVRKDQKTENQRTENQRTSCNLYSVMSVICAVLTTVTIVFDWIALIIAGIALKYKVFRLLPWYINYIIALITSLGVAKYFRRKRPEQPSLSSPPNQNAQIDRITLFQMFSGGWTIIFGIRYIIDCKILQLCNGPWQLNAVLGILSGLFLIATGVVGYQSVRASGDADRMIVIKRKYLPMCIISTILALVTLVTDQIQLKIFESLLSFPSCLNLFGACITSIYCTVYSSLIWQPHEVATAEQGISPASDEAAIPTEAERLINNTSRTRTTESGTTPTESATTPTESGTAPTESATTPTESGTTPTESATTPTESGTAVTESAITPTDSTPVTESVGTKVATSEAAKTGFDDKNAHQVTSKLIWFNNLEKSREKKRESAVLQQDTQDLGSLDDLGNEVEDHSTSDDQLPNM